MVVARVSWMILAGAFARLFTEGMTGVRVYLAVVALDAKASVATHPRSKLYCRNTYSDMLLFDAISTR